MLQRKGLMRRGWTNALVVLALVFLPGMGMSVGHAESSKTAAQNAATATNSKEPEALPEVGQGRQSLPPAVNEMRDAIIAAARTGDLDELLIPIQWNELPPDFGPRSVKDTIADWRKSSPDRSGRAWAALLINLLDAPYAVLLNGRDAENNKIYIWPAFAELPIDRLGPRLQVELLRLASASEVVRMKKVGGYDGWGLSIGADGVWHAFRRVTPITKRVKQPSQAGTTKP